MKYQNLYKIRKERKKTQKQIADLLGIATQNYWRYEQGDADISADYLIKLADYYNVSVDYLLGYEVGNQITLPPLNDVQTQIIQLILTLDNDSLFNLYGYANALRITQ